MRFTYDAMENTPTDEVDLANTRPQQRTTIKSDIKKVPKLTRIRGTLCYKLVAASNHATYINDLCSA